MLAGPILTHRLTLTAHARLRGETASGVIAGLLGRVPVPVEEEIMATTTAAGVR
jgi:hypothetical protein